MLNKNQSKKTNSWKYYVVIPALVTFVLLFQIEVIAREKPTLEILKATGNDIEILKINKETTDQELKEKTRILKENYDITATFSEVERNNKNELTSIRVELSKGKEIEQQMNVRGTNAIKAFGIVISKLENGKLNVGFKTEETVSVNENLEVLNSASSITEKEIFINGSKATEDEMNKLDPKEIESMDVSKNSGKATIKITTKHLTQPVKFSNKIIFINGVKSDAEQLNQLDQNLIDNVNVNTSDNTVRITTKTNNSEVRINTQVSTTTNQQQKPIIFINGVKADPKINIEDMSQKDIVTINVFKGKAAEDKYGSEGKNGVVEIVTKHSTKNNDTSNNVIIQSKSGNPIVISSDKINIKNTEKLLIVIDGKVIENKNIEDLDPQNIEKMDVLKGTVAVKKYGDKGKNGAIEISTKK